MSIVKWEIGSDWEETGNNTPSAKKKQKNISILELEFIPKAQIQLSLKDLSLFKPNV